jgi:hypothetical protein
METGVIDLDSVENNLVRAGLGYWRRLKGARAFPSRQEIVPRDIAGLLRNVILVKVINAGEDYEFRIVGDAHVQMSGFNMQGSHMRDLKRVSPGFAAALQKLYARVLETRQPFALRGVMDRPGQAPMSSESVLLPMGQEDSVVDHILVFSVYIPKDAPRERAAS